MGSYVIGTHNGPGPATYQSFGYQVTGGPDHYNKFGIRISGRGKEAAGIYYIYHDTAIGLRADAQLNFYIASTDAVSSNKPGAIVGTTGPVELGTARAWIYRPLSENTYLQTAVPYIIYGVPYAATATMWKTSGKKATYKTFDVTYMPHFGLQHYLHISSVSGSHHISTNDPYFTAYYHDDPYLAGGGNWVATSSQIGFKVLHTDSSHMGLGYEDELELGVADAVNRYHVFYNEKNRVVKGVGSYYYYGASVAEHDEDVRFRILEGRDQHRDTPNPVVCGTSMTIWAFVKAEALNDASGIGWMHTTFDNASVYPNWSHGIFLEAGKWYTIDLQYKETYGTRTWGLNIYGDANSHYLATILSYDSGWGYVYAHGGSGRNTEQDISYWLDVDDYEPQETYSKTGSFIFYVNREKIIRNFIFKSEFAESIGTRNFIFKSELPKYYINRNFIFLSTNVAYHTISGHVYDYRNNSDFPFANTNINIYSDGLLFTSTTTNDIGNYIVSNIPESNNIVVKPNKYDWDFSPQYIKINNFDESHSANFYCSSYPKWWGDHHSSPPSHGGNWYAFRDLLQFDTPHPLLPKGYTVRCPWQTGYNKRISTAGYFNEAVVTCVYDRGKTHMTFLSTGDGIRGITINKQTGEQSDYRLVDKPSGTDTHYAPNIAVTNDGYICLIVGGHNDSVFRVSFTDTIGDLGSLGEFSDFIINNNWNNTYPSPKVDPLHSQIVCLMRAPSTNKICLYRIYDKNTVVGDPWIAEYNNGYEIAPTVIYPSGFAIDSDGVYHVAFNYFDGYQSWNRGRAIGYMYSPPNEGGISTAGYFWYNAKGNLVSVSTGYGTKQAAESYDTVLQWMDDGYNPEYNPFFIYSWDSSQIWSDAEKYYHANLSGMAIHPTERINNGTHNIRRVCFTFYSYPNMLNQNDINREAEGYLCFYDNSSPEALSGPVGEGWVIHTVTSTALNVDGVGQLSWKGRHWGGIVIDNTPTYNVYGFIKPQEYTKWGSGEICKWISNDDGKTWKNSMVTNKSGYGIGLMYVDPSFSNESIEIVFSRGNDIVYIEDSYKYDRIRQDGEDIRVVFGNRSDVASEINRIFNYCGFEDSYIYFSLKHTIPSDMIYDTAGAYCVYYGRYDTSYSFSERGYEREL